MIFSSLLPIDLTSNLDCLFSSNIKYIQLPDMNLPYPSFLGLCPTLFF